MIGSPAHFGNPPAPVAPSASDAYRHQARRLRRLYSATPSVLHRRLKQLAAKSPAQTANESPAPSLQANSPAAWLFADRVSLHLRTGLLRYSDRIQLLREAEKIGIRRFEANLIIAVTQHRLQHPSQTLAPQKPARNGWLTFAAAALGTQAAILAIIWWAFIG